MKQGPGKSALNGDGEPPHILLVDDEAFIRDALELYFESNGFEVSAAASGGEALNIFARQGDDIDLVLLDLVMPGMHGLEVLRELKRADPAVQVIIATGCNSMDNAFEALRLGAIDYITKPILDFEEDLLKTVRSVMTAGGADATPACAEPEESKPEVPERKELSRSELLETLAGLAGSRLQSQEDQELAWKTLGLGFGANAALVIRKMDGGTWQCLQSWGSIDMEAPRSLWRSDEQDRSPRAPGPGWSGVLNVPFDGEPGEDLLLMLFYKDLSLPGRGVQPVETLSAVFSHVYNSPRREPQATIDNAASRSLDVDLST